MKKICDGIGLPGILVTAVLVVHVSCLTIYER